jgi:hypothetical protein
MRVRVRLSDQELVDDLLDFLRRRECAGELLEVALPQTLHGKQAQMELERSPARSHALPAVGAAPNAVRVALPIKGDNPAVAGDVWSGRRP